MNLDRYDLPLATASDRAAAFYRDGVDRLLSAWNGAPRLSTPPSPKIRTSRSRTSRVPASTNEHGRGAARTLAAQARQLSQRASARERAHVEIIAAAIEGRPKIALAGAEQHLEEYPRDALVLSLLLGAFGLYAFSGRADHDAARVAICERHIDHYGEDWWFLSYLGWSHTEAGHSGRWSSITERSLRCGPKTPMRHMGFPMPSSSRATRERP